MRVFAIIAYCIHLDIHFWGKKTYIMVLQLKYFGTGLITEAPEGKGLLSYQSLVLP